MVLIPPLHEIEPMNSPEAKLEHSVNSVINLQSSTRSKIKDLLFIGVGGVLGYNIIAPPIIGAVIGGISGHILHRILKI